MSGKPIASSGAGAAYNSQGAMTQVRKKHGKETMKEQPTSQSKPQERFDIPKWIKEVLMYIVFLIAFTILIFVSRNNVLVVSYQTHWLGIIDAKTEHIRDAGGVENFIDQVLLNDILQIDYFSEDRYTTPGVAGFAHGSAIIGAIKLRQVRVKAAECGGVQAIMKRRNIMDVPECYPSLSEGVEDIVYTKQEARVPPEVGVLPFFTYTRAKVTSEGGTAGKMSYYSGGGYVAKLNKTNAVDTVRQIKESKWLDPKTRALFIDFIVYSPQTDMFANVNILFEFVPGGLVYTSRSADGLFLDRYPMRSNLDKLTVLIEAIIYLVVFWYLYQEFHEMRAQGFGVYFQEGWNYVDWVNLLLFVVVGGYKANNVRRFDNIFGDEATIDPETLSDKISVLGSSLLFQDQLNGFNGFILWFKLFKYVAITRRMVRLSNTLMHIVYNVTSFCVLFLVVAYSFVMFGHLLFKSKVTDYQTALTTSVTLLKGVYGDIDLTELLSTVGTWGFMYFFFWLLVSRTLLLNVVIAILLEAYRQSRIQEQADQNKTVFEKIQEELRVQHHERGGNTMFGRFSKFLERIDDSDNNPQENQDPNRHIKKRLGWLPNDDWKPYAAEPRRPLTPDASPR